MMCWHHQKYKNQSRYKIRLWSRFWQKKSNSVSLKDSKQTENITSYEIKRFGGIGGSEDGRGGG